MILLSLVFSFGKPHRRFGTLFGIVYGHACTAAYYFFWSVVRNNYESPLFMFYVVLFYLFNLMLIIFFNWGCIRCTFFEAILYSIGAWTLEYFSNSVTWFICRIFNITGISYGGYSLAYTLITFGCYAFTWLTVLGLFKLFYREREINLNKRNLIIPLIAIYFIYAYLSVQVSTLDAIGEDVLIPRLYAISCCVLMICLVFDMFESGKYRLDLDTLEQLEKKNKEQYRISRDTVDIINTKCHDLKKMLASLGTDRQFITPQEISELQDKISIYDSFIDTQNKTLSLVLSEKSLYCEKNDIRLSVMADAPRLDFISKTDIYSMFGNILDNAIEAVIRSENVEDREIFLSVKEVGDMLIVHQSNEFDGKLNVKNGQIVTAKQDKTQHGYGLLSIRRTAEKYGGGVNIKVKDKRFLLNMMLPIPNKTE